MGTDIHAQVEIKVNAKWQWLLSGDGAYADVKGINPVAFDRSYNLFAIFCGVRNGTGFAGCKTGEGFNPISEPKGLPFDLSPELRALLEERWIFGDHSQSYVTEAELKSYDWDQETTGQGFVSVEEFKIFKRTGKPDGWCGDVFGLNVETISNEEMERGIAENDFSPEKRYYTLARWTEKYSEAVPWEDYLLLKNIRRVLTHEKEDEVEDIRIVFGFDS